jgi:hypothetical protein
MKLGEKLFVSKHKPTEKTRPDEHLQATVCVVHDGSTTIEAFHTALAEFCQDSFSEGEIDNWVVSTEYITRTEFQTALDQEEVR